LGGIIYPYSLCASPSTSSSTSFVHRLAHPL
jgi:hypothetical protein